VAVHRLRKRYRSTGAPMRSPEVLVDPSMVEDEMKVLFSALTEDLVCNKPIRRQC
jgi:hypothetical protein